MNKNSWLDNKWVITAALVFLALAMLRRGGLAFVGPLARFVVPVLIVVMVLRMIKSRIKTMAETIVREAQKNVSQPRQGGQVIDLCPRCGSYLQANHRCK